MVVAVREPRRLPSKGRADLISSAVTIVDSPAVSMRFSAATVAQSQAAAAVKKCAMATPAELPKAMNSLSCGLLRIAANARASDHRSSIRSWPQ